MGDPHPVAAGAREIVLDEVVKVLPKIEPPPSDKKPGEHFLKIISEDEIIAEEFRLYEELNSHLDTSFNSKKEQESLEQNLKDIG